MKVNKKLSNAQRLIFLKVGKCHFCKYFSFIRHSVKPHLIISICNKCRHDHHSLIYATYAVANREPETGLTGFDIGAAL